MFHSCSHETQMCDGFVQIGGLKRWDDDDICGELVRVQYERGQPLCLCLDCSPVSSDSDPPGSRLKDNRALLCHTTVLCGPQITCNTCRQSNTLMFTFVFHKSGLNLGDLQKKYK